MAWQRVDAMMPLRTPRWQHNLGAFGASWAEAAAAAALAGARRASQSLAAEALAPLHVVPALRLALVVAVLVEVPVPAVPVEEDWALLQAVVAEQELVVPAAVGAVGDEREAVVVAADDGAAVADGDVGRQLAE